MGAARQAGATMTGTMDRRTFERLRALVYESAGIALGDHKEVLLSARVSKRMRALGMTDYRTYLEHVLDDPAEVVGLLDAVSTNVTSFFREETHFEMLGDSFERSLAAGQRRFRFWSAACATGEEPYSMAIALLERLATRAYDTSGLDIRILATDISTRALETAKGAEYEHRRIAGLSAERQRRWFRRSGEGTVRLSAAASSLVTFARLNLAKPPFPMRGPFDAVLCRNVMIYFDAPVRRGLLAEVHRLLAPGGVLMLGHAESLAGAGVGLAPVVPSVYRKP